jgi:hypothetical protein
MSLNYTVINYFPNSKVSIKVIQYSPISMNLSPNPLPLLSFSWVFFVSSTLILQMANTRNRNNNSNGNNNGENNQDVNPPPPPPPTLEQVLIMQAQMLQTMQQTLVNMQAAQPQAPPPPPRDRLGEFQRTKLPTFSQAMEPMDADDWIKSVEKKLQVVQCNNREKVLLASHQLSGPVADWWDAYVEAQGEPESINWPKFRAAFWAHHVPQGVIKLKKKEFQNLKQGSMSVNEYVTKFTQLSRYAPHEVDTDEKKQECFLNGLDDGLPTLWRPGTLRTFKGW